MKRCDNVAVSYVIAVFCSAFGESISSVGLRPTADTLFRNLTGKLPLE